MNQVELIVDVLPSTMDRLEAIQDAFEEQGDERPSKSMIVDLAIEEFYETHL